MPEPQPSAQPSVRIFSAAGRYVQGPGALDRLGEQVAQLGDSVLVLVDEFMLPVLGDRIAATLEAAGVDAVIEGITGEVTNATIERLATDRPADIELVIGVGGGKTIDLAKGVSRILGVPIVTVPTIASNDSPASRAIAIYDEQHQLAEVPVLPRNPALVVVDTAVIIQAPPRFLAAGIGDAIAKHFEVAACRAAGGTTMQGSLGLRIASVVAEGCYRILREHAVGAMAAAKAGTIDDAFEASVEAIILLSGMAFENGGLAIAHALTRGLMAAPGASAQLHGEHVGYGALVQRAVEGAGDDELRDLADFLGSVGLPTTLSGLRADPAEETLTIIVDRTMTAPHITNAPRPVTPGVLRDALVRIEHHGTLRAVDDGHRHEGAT